MGNYHTKIKIMDEMNSELDVEMSCAYDKSKSILNLIKNCKRIIF